MSDMRSTLVFDIECYVNYFLIAFRNVASGKVLTIEQYEGHPLDVDKVRRIVQKFRLVSFNGINYDIPVLSMALTGADCKTIRAVSDDIIVRGIKWWEIGRARNFGIIEVNHIDLFNVAPGKASLKLYGGRMNCRTLQDLPIDPDSSISPEQRETLRTYCVNDLDLTYTLFMKLQPQLELRAAMSTEYGMDLRSKGDPQIAEAVLKLGVQAITGKRVTRPEIAPWTKFQYKMPSFIVFHTRPLQQLRDEMEAAMFKVDLNGSVVMPETLEDMTIPIGSSVYRMGIGGLHSSETVIAHHTTDEVVLSDHDVRAYYPSIVINGGLYPPQMGDAFLKVYRDIYRRRLAAKDAGDKTADSALKIVINSSFGKFGNKWSVLYSPDLLIQVTITGQLSLLMLIEMLELQGIPVVSANTDGIVVACPVGREEERDLVIEDWEMRTGFETEATRYKSLYSRDVNNYIAIKPDGSVKLKGAFAPAGLQKNPANLICVDAVVAHLTAGVLIEKTIRECTDISKFVTVRTVNGGGVQGDKYLGRVVRWVYSTTHRNMTINYKTNGNLVAKSHGARPCMTLPDVLPDDIDYGWYIREANGILADVGATC